MLSAVRDEKLAKLYSDTKDERLFEELYTRHVEFVRRFLDRYIYNRSVNVDAQAVIDDTFQALHTKCMEGVEISNVKGYLIQMAKLFVMSEIDHNSKQKRTARLQPIISDPVDRHVASPNTALIREEVARLPDNESSAIVAVYLLGADLTTAAESLGISLATLKRRLQSGLNRLRKRITPEVL